MQQIASDITYIGSDISNVYLVGEPSGPWVVVDSGIPGRFEVIKAAAESRFGADSQPDAIILTHAHLDHYGSALAMATYWDVPIYAHRLDLPYLTGRSKLPPSDPTVGGPLAFAARFMPTSGTDLGDVIHALPDDKSVPGMPGWIWEATPGHTPGHISLFREADRVLLAGDAVLTVNPDRIKNLLTKAQTLAHPPAAATYDWIAVRRSLKKLALLKPTLIASGHGVPMKGTELAGQLEHLANDFLPPLHGRYVAEPAIADENGIVSVPPPAPDLLPKAAVVLALAGLIGFGIYRGTTRGSKELTEDSISCH